MKQTTQGAPNNPPNNNRKHDYDTPHLFTPFSLLSLWDSKTKTQVPISFHSLIFQPEPPTTTKIFFMSVFICKY